MAVDRLARLRADLLLLLVAFIWGSAFVAQRMAAAQTGVFLYNAARFLVGGLCLLALARFRLNIPREQTRWVLLAGSLLFGASVLQQAGLVTTTAGNAAFITGLYVVLVPLFLVARWRSRLPWTVWLAVALAVAGMLLLSTGGRLALAPGDALELAGAGLWALHVITVGRAMRHLDALPFSAGQFLIACVFNLLAGLIFERPALPGLVDAAGSVLYVGVFSTAIGYTLQAVGQRHAPPTDAAIILSGETVFAALFGFLILDEKLSTLQLTGCILMLAAMLLAQFSRSESPSPQTDP
jgi:drug/metabolite transporter (DMT)-like permease